MKSKGSADKTVRDIRRKIRRRHSSEEKIRIVLDGLRGEDSISALYRREGIAERLYYSWSKEFLEAGKKRLTGDTTRQANSGEVKALRTEARDAKATTIRQLYPQISGGLTEPIDQRAGGWGGWSIQDRRDEIHALSLRSQAENRRLRHYRLMCSMPVHARN